MNNIDYNQLAAEGRIVELPAKLGSYIYVVKGDKNGEHRFVSRYLLSGIHMYDEYRPKNYPDPSYLLLRTPECAALTRVSLKQLGKTVFIDESAARECAKMSRAQWAERLAADPESL